MSGTVEPKIIVALDYPTAEQARKFLDGINPTLCRIKIAQTLFTHYGPSFVREIIEQGFSVFLDLKYHDIPQQVAGAVRSACELGVWMLTVHAQGGVAMLQAARKAAMQYPRERQPLLIAVTVLTSINQNDLAALGVGTELSTLVSRLAQIAQQGGMDGVVCSPLEIALLRDELPELKLITPGIRQSGDANQDQKRVMTPQAAIAAGADYLVIGRSITQAADPAETLRVIHQTIQTSIS